MSSDIVLDALLLFVPLLHVYLAPYTKVEESFNLHATHDVLMYGLKPSLLRSYDHFVFPGAVPRTFIGSIALGWISTPLLLVSHFAGFLKSKANAQMIVRFTLATINSICVIRIRRSVSVRYGRLTSAFFALLSASQFHLPFWMGRTLPNMFALPLVNLAHGLLVEEGPKPVSTTPGQTPVSEITRLAHLYLAISLLTVAGIVFRAELALLLGALVLCALISRRIKLSLAVQAGVAAAPPAIMATFLVDSYFWKVGPLWPELAGVFFNVFQGKSSEWGVSPWHTYISSALPKLLLSSLPLSLFSITVDSRSRSFLLPNILFVALISALAHKEWRFVVYVVPAFNVAAAQGLRVLYRACRQRLRFFAPLLVLAPIVVNIGATAFFVKTSMENYPGGAAISHLNDRFSHLPEARIHICNLAAQTGASLFLQVHSPPYAPHLRPPSQPALNWTYSKTDATLAPDDFNNSNFTHLILESSPGTSIGKLGWSDLVEVKGAQWRVVHETPTFERWKISPTWIRAFKQRSLKELKGLVEEGVWPMSMKTSTALWILERVPVE